MERVGILAGSFFHGLAGRLAIQLAPKGGAAHGSCSLALTFAFALSTTLLLSADTLAAEQLLTGRKLFIKNPFSGATSNKMVHLSKDPAITLGVAGSAGDPQCTGAGGGGGSLTIAASGGAGDVTIPLPCAGWTTNGTNTFYKYKDPTNATCTSVLVMNGVLAKAVCKGSQVGIDLNGSMSPTAVVTTLNANRYCTEYGGDVVKDGSNDKAFLRKDAPPPPACASTTTSTSSTTSTTTELDPVCCEDGPGGFCHGTTNYVCVVAYSGTPVYNAVCDATGDCVTQPGTAGGCCEGALFGPYCVNTPDESSCHALSGGSVFHPASVCQPDATCAP